MELKRYTVTEMLCKRKLGSRLSPETDVIFCIIIIIIIIIIIVIVIILYNPADWLQEL